VPGVMQDILIGAISGVYTDPEMHGGLHLFMYRKCLRTAIAEFTATDCSV